MVCVGKNESFLKYQHLKIIGQSTLKGEVKISGAKNSALVLLAASILTDDKIILDNVPQLTDIEKMCNILEDLGVYVEIKNNQLIIDSKNISLKELPYKLVNGLRASFFCIGALLARFGEASIPLPGGCNIGKRPINEHIRGLNALGAEIIIERDIVKAKLVENKNRLRGTNIRLNCPSVGATETLIMAASLAEGRTVIENAAREPEIQDLCKMLNKMGAKIYDYGKEKIIIDGVQNLRGCSHTVIPDRIEAGTFLIAAAATSSSITVSPVIPDHLEALLDKLEESGCEIIKKDNSISIKCIDDINAVDIKTEPFPGFPTDLQAPFMALMTTAKGKSMITETIFENRMNHVELLNQMGGSITVKNNVAHINGAKKLIGTTLVGLDLRSSAALVIAALVSSKTSRIYGLDHLDRGYENFELKLSQLGVQVTREITSSILDMSDNKNDNPNKKGMSSIKVA